MLIYLAMIDNEEDKSKFEQIYNTYKQTMFYAANRILKDEYMSEDAVHLAFLRIINHLDKIVDINSHKTKGFIVIIVENIAIDIYRKRKRENNISYDEVEIYLTDPKDFTISIENEVEEAIMKLPVIYSTVLRLKYSQGYNDREIAKILNITEANVRQRIVRGKKRLAEILQNAGD
ncbi:MAG: RNA polymerase sigma factor [Clostridiales bacterium]|nr:RNA polymerase sigma factor [Clostridiales bacterium]